jgi:hypothetical protein
MFYGMYCQINSTMKYFIKYSLSWVSQNLAVPFWMVGHIHLMSTIYQDITEIIASVGMNLIVAAGFIHDFIEYKKEKTNK